MSPRLRKQRERAKAIEKAARLAWGSMETHLPLCYRGERAYRTFHKKCVKEYAELLKLLASMY